MQMIRHKTILVNCVITTIIMQNNLFQRFVHTSGLENAFTKTRSKVVFDLFVIAGFQKVDLFRGKWSILFFRAQRDFGPQFSP